METPAEIRKHIEVLTAFEKQYREFVHALEEERRTGASYWHPHVFAEKRRNVLKAAPRADLAAKASGYWLTVYDPPALGGRARSEDLSSQVMDYDDPVFSDDGLDIPRQILDAIPIQIASLEMELEKAERCRPRRRSKSWSEPKSDEKSWADPGPLEEQPLPVGEPSANRPKLTEVHVGVFALPFVIAAAVFPLSGSPLAAVLAGIGSLAFLSITPVRNRLVRLIDRVIGP